MPASASLSMNLTDIMIGAALSPAPRSPPTGPTATAAMTAGRPAVIAAVAVGPVGGLLGAGDNAAPIMMSVRFIDSDALASIAAQLRLTHLRKLDGEPAPSTDLTYEVVGPQGNLIARFAWTPKQPGAEIVSSVIPFIAVALAEEDAVG